VTAQVSLRRRNTWVALAVGVVAALLVPVLVVVAGSAITRSSAAVNVGADSVLEIPPTPVGAVATVNAGGELTSITAFALAPRGDGGAIVSVPVGGRVRATGVSGASLAAVGGVRLGDVYVSEGDESFARELSTLLNTSLEFVEVLAASAAVEVLEAAGVDDDLAARLAEAIESSSDKAEFERWTLLGEVWEEISGRSEGAADRPVAEAQTPRSFADLLEAVLRGSVAYHQFALEPVLSAESNPDLLDLYDLDRSEVVMVMASVAPSAVVAANPSLNVQIDSSFDFEVTQRAVGRVLFVGANVLLVRQLDTPAPTVTHVRTSVRLSDKDIDTFESLFGEVEVIEAEERVEGIDVQIRLGTLFAEAEDLGVSDR
jgi:hypothetical protein